ncbi:MAG TPA: hypothetical protein VF273_01130 [Pelobium sp.]
MQANNGSRALRSYFTGIIHEAGIRFNPVYLTQAWQNLFWL